MGWREFAWHLWARCAVSISTLMRSERTLPTEHLRNRPGDHAIKVCFDPIELLARKVPSLTGPAPRYCVGLPVDGGFHNYIIADSSMCAVERPTFGVYASLCQDAPGFGRDTCV
jgi:hypothetical protein